MARRTFEINRPAYPYRDIQSNRRNSIRGNVMLKLINSIIAIMLFVLACVQHESNRIDKRIARIEIEHNRLLQDQIIETQVMSAALSEISRSIDQVGGDPIPQRN